MIDVYCNDGSPMGLIPPDIYGKGVGGAELALMSWAEVMARGGHQIRVYNDPSSPGEYDEVEYLPNKEFEPDHKKRDVFILWRSPNPVVKTVRAEMKIHWSTDQYTIGNFKTDIFPFVDKVVCISPFHVDYHRKHYGVENGKIGYFDLGVRLEDYAGPAKRIPGRCIFCSVPDRGLDILYMLWPQIKEIVPHASLVITSDYRLWGISSPNNHHHRMRWLHQPDVMFLGKIERKQLVREQMAAVCQPYPCNYEELFCISAAECQVSGARPVTSPIGALSTTNKWGAVISGNPIDKAWQNRFVATVVEAIGADEDARRMEQEKARQRFDWNRICEQWESLIEKGKFDEN